MKSNNNDDNKEAFPRSFQKSSTTSSITTMSASEETETTSCSSSFHRLSDNNTTQVYHTADGAPYIICTSTEPFINPTTTDNNNTTGSTPEESINDETFNLTLGTSFLTWRSATSPVLLQFLERFDKIFVDWWIHHFFYIYAEWIPPQVKRNVIFAAWKYVYLPFHQAFLYKRTGLHPSLSVEYHALTTLLWWAQFCVITPQRIQFSLGELYVISPTDIPTNEYIERVRVDRKATLVQSLNIDIPVSQMDHCIVQGIFVHPHNHNKYQHGILNQTSDDENNQKQKSTRKIIVWLYGGAYLGGDCRGNMTVAQEFANDCYIDGVFIPKFRLAPNATIDDVLWDVCLAYHWACTTLVDDPSTQITLVGPSSGAGVALRLMQLISERQRNVSLLPSFLEPLLDTMKLYQPCSAVLFGPYIDYTEPKRGSFLHCAKHDLIVTEAVQQYGLPYLNDFIPKIGTIDHETGYNGQGRREYSPLYRSMEGLPPLCFVVSEHEACYDMTIAAVNKARTAGVPVTVGVWKYMCHVFSFLHAFLPEGKLSIDFAKEWIRQRNNNNNNNNIHTSSNQNPNRSSSSTTSSKKTTARLPLGPATIIGIFLLAMIAWWLPMTAALSLQIPMGGYSLDRFQSVCPANLDAIERFDPSLVVKTTTTTSSDSDSDSDSTSTSSSVWVAVYRSNNNKPSVMIRDEFFHSMSIATSGKTDGSSTSSSSSFLSETRSFLETSSTSNLQTPVAVAQLRPSPDFDDCYVLDSLRCSLKKEDMDESCDGGSEFLEALGVAVDSLVLHHLKRLQDSSKQDKSQGTSSFESVVFEGTLRTKATLFSGKILEQRGFEPVDSLAKDMATHVSRYEACLNQYAERSIPGGTPSPTTSGKGFSKSSSSGNAKSITAGTQDRALQIVSLLGQLDPEIQKQAAAKEQEGPDEEYDPWAGINLRR
ncbi:esterase [Nitzschia inconspicua]|uniref:Esterase n=1 Tax=Nitzschia inconspicua TaxID=303405 RepID=A0A9K3M7A0_9STRA|nr:esterase [Nitzschia inconspicua]